MMDAWMDTNKNKRQKTYNFNPLWEEQFFFIYFKGKCLCLLCNATVAVPKKCNVERHFNTIHKDFNTNFPMNSEIRKKRICELKLNITKYQSISTCSISQTKKATIASFKIAHLLAKKKKPFIDGELVKEAMLLASDSLFDDYKNKSEITAVINTIQLSAEAVTQRIEVIATDIESELKRDVQKCIFFSLQLNESTNISDTTQLTIMVKMVFDNFSIKEELLKILPLKGETTGGDIYLIFKDYVEENNLPLEKLTTITTDGTPAMKGKKHGFITLCKQDCSFPKFVSYDCIIHQDMLCTKVIPFQHVTQTVAKIINFIRATAMQHQLSKLLLQEEDAEFDDLTYTEVRWLSKGVVLERFLNLLPQVKEFLISRDEPCLQLEDKTWLLDLGFLSDLMVKFNEFNLKLQDRNHHIAQMISTVNSFKAKLALWTSHLMKNNLSHFPNLRNIIEDFTDSDVSTAHFALHFETLLEEFSSRFQEFSELDSFVIFFINPFTSTDEDIFVKIATYFHISNAEDLELEIISMKTDIILRSHQNDETFWNLVNKNNYPLLRKCALKMHSYCVSTYSYESLFSNMKYLKSKYRAQLTDSHLEHFLRTGNSSYVPDYNKLAENMEPCGTLMFPCINKYESQ